MFTTNRARIDARTAGRHADITRTPDGPTDWDVYAPNSGRHAATVPVPRDPWSDDPDRTTRRDTYA